MTNPDDIDRWSDRLAGRSAPGVPDEDGAEALRRSIRAADESARAEGAQDRVGLERLTRRLEAEGLLAPAAAPAAHARRLRPWFAAAATVAAIAVGLRLYSPAPDVGSPATGTPGVEKPRGFSGVVKQSVPDVEAAAVRVTAELAALGLQARRAPSDGRVVLEVDVSADQLQAYGDWVAPRGGRAGEPGTYRIILEPVP